MPAVRLQAPAAPAITLDDAKRNLRIDGNELDALVMAWVQGVTDHAEHLMGRAILSQVWRVTVDSWRDPIPLPRPPLLTVLAVRMREADGHWRVIPPERYLADADREPALLHWLAGAPLPSLDPAMGAVQIDYVCGYGADTASTPPAIRLYLLAKLAEQFDAGSRPDRNSVQPSFIDRVLDRYCIPELA